MAAAAAIASVSSPSSACLDLGDVGLDLGLDVGRDLVGVLAEELLGRVDERRRPELRISTASRRLRSSSAYCSASAIILSMSSLLRAEPPVIVIDCSRPVPRSLADTLTMPLASMSNVTSICGMPRGAGGRPVRSKLPSSWLLDGHLALALVDLDHHRGLVVVGGAEDLRPLGGDRGVALDELGHHAALGLDAETQRGDVEQQHVLDLALEHTGLQDGADGDDLVGVDALVGLLATGQLA